jgi:ABC-type phosphate transport system substrate-binding protein
MKMIFLLLITLTTFPVQAQRILIVTNALNKSSQITLDQLQDIYFKRSRNWSDGKPVRFFDRLDNSGERTQFLKYYLKKTSRQVDQFWIGQKFNTGDSSPIQVPSDTMTLNLISRFPGGIGYVKEGTSLPPSVKVLEISDL